MGLYPRSLHQPFPYMHCRVLQLHAAATIVLSDRIQHRKQAAHRKLSLKHEYKPCAMNGFGSQRCCRQRPVLVSPTKGSGARESPPRLIADAVAKAWDWVQTRLLELRLNSRIFPYASYPVTQFPMHSLRGLNAKS